MKEPVNLEPIGWGIIAIAVCTFLTFIVYTNHIEKMYKLEHTIQKN